MGSKSTDPTVVDSPAARNVNGPPIAGFNQRKVDYLSQVCKSGCVCVCVCMREGHAYHVKLVMSDESA